MKPLRPRVAGTLLLAASVLAACSSSDGSGRGSPSASSVAATTATTNASASTPTTASAPTSADAVLQARLRDAARSIDAIEAVRGPGGLLADDFHWDANPPRDPAAERARPQVRAGEVKVVGALPPEIVKRVARQNWGRFRRCYEDVLQWKAAVEGRVTSTFVIDERGAVGSVAVTTDVADPMFAACMKRGFSALSFPAPEGGVVQVTFPLTLTLGQVAAAAPGADGLDGGIGTPSAPPGPPARPPADQDWPIVIVEGDAISLGGREVAKTTAISGPGVQRVDALTEAMRELRWKSGSAWDLTTPPGVAGLRIRGTTPAVVFKSVVQTMALAGYPTVLVQPAEQPDAIVEMAAQLPILFASPEATDAMKRGNDPAFFLDVKAVETSIVSKIERRVVRSQKIVSASEVGPALCQAWEKDGLHREPREVRRDRVILTGDDDLTAHAILTAARAALGCTRARTESGAETKVPAFWVHFAAR